MAVGYSTEGDAQGELILRLDGAGTVLERDTPGVGFLADARHEVITTWHCLDGGCAGVCHLVEQSPVCSGTGRRCHRPVRPKDGTPVTSWDNQDEAWVNVVQGIQKQVEELTGS